MNLDDHFTVLGLAFSRAEYGGNLPDEDLFAYALWVVASFVHSIVFNHSSWFRSDDTVEHLIFRNAQSLETADDQNVFIVLVIFVGISIKISIKTKIIVWKMSNELRKKLERHGLCWEIALDNSYKFNFFLKVG